MAVAVGGMTRLQKARSQMLFGHPFFATLLVATPMVIDESIPTAATDMQRIYYNPAFTDTLTLDELKFLMAHEVAHIMFRHGMRLMGRDPKLWNSACDYAINWILKECGLTFIAGGLLDARYAGLSAEVIYERLQQQQKAQPKPKQGQGQGQGQGSGPSGTGQSDTPQQGQGQPGSGDGLPQDVLGQDLREPSTAGDPVAHARLERSIQQRVAQAASMARMAGKLPGALARLVDEMLDPVVPWPVVLRDYMTRITQDDESWTKRNRRIQHVYLPSRHTERMGEVVVIGDSSGSMYEDVKKGIAEVRSIAEMMHPERIRLVWADTRVAGEQVFEENEELLPVVAGGGGTDMRVPLAYVEQFEPQVVILVTDGYTPWPDAEPPYPLIVLCTTDTDCPIGQVIRV